MSPLIESSVLNTVQARTGIRRNRTEPNRTELRSGSGELKAGRGGPENSVAHYHLKIERRCALYALALTYRSRKQTQRAVVVQPTQHVDLRDRGGPGSPHTGNYRTHSAHSTSTIHTRRTSARAQLPTQARLGQRSRLWCARAAGRRPCAAPPPLTRAAAARASRPQSASAARRRPLVAPPSSHRRRTATRRTAARKRSRGSSTCPTWIACDPRW